MKIDHLYKQIAGREIVTDTRKIVDNSVFFALKGANFNGNEFTEEALKKGAALAVIDENKHKTSGKTVLVKDVLKTLQQLARYHRQQLKIPIIALTGSNGKTTTKELIKAVLSQKFKVCATVGNYNNHIGVPLTLLSMTKDTDIGIVEMGANHPGEIAFLCQLAEPNFGYITNFGKAHLEGFGSLEGVVKAKSEIYEYLRKTKGYAFVNTDDAIQKKQTRGLRQFSYDADEIKFLNANPFVVVEFNKAIIKSNLIGSYNYKNIAAAIAFGDHFKIQVNNIKKAIEGYKPTNNRSQIIKKGLRSGNAVVAVSRMAICTESRLRTRMLTKRSRPASVGCNVQGPTCTLSRGRPGTTKSRLTAARVNGNANNERRGAYSSGSRARRLTPSTTPALSAMPNQAPSGNNAVETIKATVASNFSRGSRS